MPSKPTAYNIFGYDKDNKMITEPEWRIYKAFNDYCTVYVIPSRGSDKSLTALCQCIKLLDSGKRIILIDPREQKEK